VGHELAVESGADRTHRIGAELCSLGPQRKLFWCVDLFVDLDQQLELFGALAASKPRF